MTEQRHHLVRTTECATIFPTWQEASASFATLDVEPLDPNVLPSVDDVQWCGVHYHAKFNGWLASITIKDGRFVRFVTRS